jgi:hypothetical protein
MRTGRESHRGYLIEVVHRPPVWIANIYPESAQVPPPNPALLPIQRITKEEAFTAARKRIDEMCPPARDDS